MAISGLCAAYLLNKNARLALVEAEAVISLIRFLRTEIECFAIPIPRALARCPKEILDGCGYKSDKPPQNTEVLALCLADTEAAEQLKRFSREIGRGYTEEQLSLCDYYIAIFEERRQRIAQQLPMRTKMNLTLCVSSALAVVILLF